MAFVGIGQQGIGVMEAFLKHADVQGVAVCDVHDKHHRDRSWGEGRILGREVGKSIVDEKYDNQDCAAYSDFRELIARSDIDAVQVATPDHWHALITLAALRSGKDVYCEKPVTHVFAEGRAVVEAVAKHQSIFQVGSQQRSDPKFRRAVEVVRNGHLGNVRRVEVGLLPSHSKPQGDPGVVELPAGLDYEMWCGPGPVLPYMRARHHRSWRYHTAFGGGTLMDWIGHHNDIAHWGLDLERGGPLRVEAMNWTWPETEIYDTPVDYDVVSDYEGDVQIRISSRYEMGVKWIGTNGWLSVSRKKQDASTPAWLEENFDAGDWKAYRSPGHQRNFVDSVKSRRETVAPAEIGHRSITPGHLGWMSAKLGRPVKWDPATETIPDDQGAQAELEKLNYRAPWSLDKS